MTINKNEYEKSLEVVKKYEKRQKELSKLNSDLGACLQQFSQFKFDVDEKNGKVVFAGVHKDNGKFVMSSSVVSKGDVWEEVIGKLVSCKKSLGENFDYINQYIETYSFEKNMYIRDSDLGTTYRLKRASEFTTPLPFS